MSFKNYIEKNFKCWGIKYEAELPLEFVITKHANERLKQRFNCSPDKLKKIVIKSWYSKDIMTDKLYKKIRQKNKQPNIVARYYLGYIFVFATKRYAKYNILQKTLITTFNPKHYV